MINDIDKKTTPTLLNNRYQVIQILGEGGFGTTFLAEDHHLPSKQKCVVKQLKPINDNPQIHQLVQERFQREAAILEELSQNNDQIPKLYAYFTEDEQFYLVEEWIEGDTLTQKVQKQGVLNESSVKELLRQILAVIDYIHQKPIIHRDIKPDNIIIRQKDGKPVLIDFGAVKETMGAIVNSQGKSSHSIVVGTPGFIPIEQSAGRPMYASDLYSLGLTAIYLLSGKMPQDLETDPLTGKMLWQAQVKLISDQFADFLTKAVQLQPNDRFTTAQEMLKALEALEQNTVPIATVISAPPTASASIPTQITVPPQPPRPPNEWKKGVIIGSIIGGSILLSTFLIKDPLLSLINQPSKDSKPHSSSTPAQVSPTPTPPSPTPSVTQVIPSPQPIAPPVQSTNATVAGELGYKNIRSGPGTIYGVVATGYTGDRVQILGNGYDNGGYLWYKVYHPKSGASGWIAAQLISTD